MRSPLRTLVGIVKAAVARPISSEDTPVATTRPSQRTVMLLTLGVKFMPRTDTPVWPRRPMLGVISIMAGGLSKTA